MMRTSFRKIFIFISLVAVCFAFSLKEKQSGYIQRQPAVDSIPAVFIGNFKDDYGIGYSVTDSLFTQHPNVKYHILRWNLKEHYFIAKNDTNNPSEQGLYSRIDYMEFTGMEPFNWGFCLTSYNAATDLAAEQATSADRTNPKKGCGGFPFSRMKRR